METLKIIIIEYLLGYCLQSYSVMLGVYTLNGQKVIVKDYILVSAFLSIIGRLVRLLPISFGVNIIINMLCLYLLCVIILKMPVYKTIRSVTICIVLILICEMAISTVLVISIGNEHFESVMANSLQKSIIGVMANVIFAFLVIITYFILRKKGDNNRSISE